MKKLSCLSSFHTILMCILSFMTFGALAEPVHVKYVIDTAFPVTVPMTLHQVGALSPEPVLGLFKSGHGFYVSVDASTGLMPTIPLMLPSKKRT